MMHKVTIKLTGDSALFIQAMANICNCNPSEIILNVLHGRLGELAALQEKYPDEPERCKLIECMKKDDRVHLTKEQAFNLRKALKLDELDEFQKLKRDCGYDINQRCRQCLISI